MALGLGLASCDNFDYPNPPAQSNPQEPVLDAAVALQMEAQASAIDLNGIGAIEIAKVVSTEGIDPDFVLSFKGLMSSDENFANPVEFNVVTVDNVLYAGSAELAAVYRDAFKTIDPAVRTAYIRFKAYAGTDEETVSYRLGGLDAYFCPMTVSVSPLRPDFFVDQAYYFIYSDDAETWAKDKAVKLNHTDRSVYDDPTFSVILNFSQTQVGDGLYWKIIPATTYETFDLSNGAVYGVPESDSESNSGALDPSADQLAGYFDLVGPAQFNINMRYLSFSFLQAIENFWIAGDNVNGREWGDCFNAGPTMFTFDYVNYAGVANLNAEFKFSPTNAWSGDFGSDGGATLEDNGGQVYATGIATGSKNISVPEPGFYAITLNNSTKAFSLLKIESMGIIGGFNDWGASVDMTASDDNFVYTLTANLNAGDEWKFRANGQWTFSLGGDFNNLSPFNGSNFVCTETGTYDITLNLSALPWTATVVKK